MKKKLPFRPLLLAAAMGVVPAAFAQEAPAPDVFQLRAGVGLEHDNNVLRQNSGEISDTMGVLTVGAKVEKQFGLQRVRADIEGATFHYQDHSELNYTTLNYAAAWDWSLTPHFHGVLSADRRQYREVSTDSITFVNSIGRRTERNEVLEGMYDVGARVRLLGGFTHYSSESTEPRSWDASPHVRSARVGIGYETPKGTLLTARVRRGEGEYTETSPGSATGDFDEREVEVALKWPVTAKTAVEARLAHLERDHGTAPQLDFSGMVGGASVSWEITGKTKLMAGYVRDLIASGQILGGHVESDRFYIAPVWQFAPHLALNFRYDRAARRWRDVPVGPDVGRRETVETAQIGVDWDPRPAFTLSASVRGERLDSSLPTSSYNATVFAIAAKARF
ncbi:MAG: outer membrane beta-barrel protein [Ramlibacter sp.]|nr:outer membrane beta-barrel protein [Ramlibacter sp.]